MTSDMHTHIYTPDVHNGNQSYANGHQNQSRSDSPWIELEMFVVRTQLDHNRSHFAALWSQVGQNHQWDFRILELSKY